MRILAIGIEHPLDVPVQGPHDADARKHRRPAERHHQDQGFHRCLPLSGRVLGFRELRDVIAGILQRDELAAAGQRDGLVEWPFPAGCFTRCDARAPG
jgi:hypothetical protein